jgi:uncharacterized protein YchJ
MQLLSVVLLIASCALSRAFSPHTSRCALVQSFTGTRLYAGFGVKKEAQKTELVVPAADQPCACGSSKAYSNCCGPLHSGAARDPSPTEVIRARFSSLVYVMPDYVISSSHPDNKDYVAPQDADEIIGGSKRSKRVIWERDMKRFAESWDFKALEFEDEARDAQAPAEGDAFVTLKLLRKTKNTLKWETVDEKSRFRRTAAGQWAFVSTDMKVQKPEGMVTNAEGRGLSSFSK